MTCTTRLAREDAEWSLDLFRRVRGPLTRTVQFTRLMRSPPGWLDGAWLTRPNELGPAPPSTLHAQLAPPQVTRAAKNNSPPWPLLSQGHQDATNMAVRIFKNKNK